MSEIYHSDLENATLDATLPGWTTGSGGSNFFVKLGATIGKALVAGTKCFTQGNNQYSSLYTAAGVLTNQAVRIDRKSDSISGFALRNNASGTIRYQMYTGTIVNGGDGLTYITAIISYYNSGTVQLANVTTSMVLANTPEVSLVGEAVGNVLNLWVWPKGTVRPTTPTATVTVTGGNIVASGYPGLMCFSSAAQQPVSNIVVADGVADTAYFDPVPDTTAPVLSAYSGTATGTTTANGTVTTNEANGTLYYTVTTSATDTAANIKAGASLSISTAGAKSLALAGLIQGTTYYLHLLHRDAAGNDSTVYNSAAFTTVAVDSTPPVMTGTITSSGVTSGGFTYDWSGTTRSDAVGITGYETSSDGGSTWVDRGNVTSVALTGLTASTSYTRLVRAYDAAGNKSTPALSITVVTSASADVSLPVLSGTITVGTVAQNSIQFSWPGATDNIGVTGYETSIDGGATYTNAGNVNTLIKSGLTAATTYQVRVRAYDAAGNRSSPPLSVAITTAAAPDTVVPTFTGVISVNTITNSGFTADWSATAYNDNVAVTGFETSPDNGNTWVDRGNVTSFAFTGLGASTAYTRLVRAYDAAGNKSLPLSVSATTFGAGATITYPSAGKNIQTGKRLGVAHSATVHNKTTHAIIATITGLMSDVSSGLCSFTHAALVPNTEYLVIVTANADSKDVGFFWATAV